FVENACSRIVFGDMRSRWRSRSARLFSPCARRVPTSRPLMRKTRRNLLCHPEVTSSSYLTMLGERTLLMPEAVDTPKCFQVGGSGTTEDYGWRAGLGYLGKLLSCGKFFTI